jgi:Zn-dependent protease/predicted transcriptional regulator
MKWSWKLARVAGIDVYMHATFLLIIGWVGVSYWLGSHTWDAVLSGIAFILAIFAFVVMHEYGHALTARKYGIQTRDITLYPIGGLARLERMPEVPIQELWVALAGPAVNVLAAVVIFAWLFLSNTLTPISGLSITSGSFLERLMIVNVWLVLFNLIPAFPMDGGRVLRAILAMRLEYTQATQAAAAVGQGIAFIFGFVGLFTDPFLLFIALFVWMGAEQESNMVRMKYALGGIPVSRAMMTEFETLDPDDRMQRVVDLILAGSQHDFPVVRDGAVVGALNREDFISALTKQGPGARVSDVMRRDLPTVDSYEMVEAALNRLNESHNRMLPVTHGGRLVGLITNDNVTEFLMIRSALKKGTASRSMI